jgi:hypothetical protein
MRIEFRPENLHVGNATAPQRSQYISDKNVLDNALTQRRMGKVTIFRRHAPSRYRE